MPAQNKDIASIYQSLCQQEDSLQAQLETTTDPKQAGVIATEIQEIAHRITLVQNLLFLADSAQVAAAVPGIEGAAKQLAAAAGRIQDVTAFLKSVSDYLACVDDAIDLAKAAAAAA